MRSILKWLAFPILFLLFAAIGAAITFETMPSRKSCVLCHEIRTSRDHWAASAHREVDCKACHGSSIGSWRAIHTNSKRLWSHVRTDRHPGMRMDEEQMLEMIPRCGTCHQTQYAAWQRNGHATSYAKFLLDDKKNAEQKPADLCLRCHGMFAGVPFMDMMYLDASNRVWRFADSRMASRPAITCHSCHAGHTDPAIATNGVFFYSRADECRFAAKDLMQPKVTLEGRPVRMAGDSNSKLCIQCHAPLSSAVSGSGDDKTPTGLHEGLSCTVCHDPHSGSTVDSCLQCHPAFSRCKERDVRRLDTTYRTRESPHDVHHLTCATCHPAPATVK
ncbi:MAG: cytochrome c3 family protein [Kiritimatiellae bacterium]|nr:cytochrome c3 family protein [Kiritimatiellia bacterium]